MSTQPFHSLKLAGHDSCLAEPGPPHDSMLLLNHPFQHVDTSLQPRKICIQHTRGHVNVNLPQASQGNEEEHGLKNPHQDDNASLQPLEFSMPEGM